MLKRVEEIRNKMKKLNANSLAMTVFVLPQIKQYIIKLNLVDQLYNQGIDVNDHVIGTYSYTTALANGENHYIYNGLVSVKKFGEPYTLFQEGDLYESFNLVYRKDGFVITADTQKPDKDLMDYGEILGLTEESKNELAKKILPLLQKSLRELLLA